MLPDAFPIGMRTFFVKMFIRATSCAAHDGSVAQNWVFLASRLHQVLLCGSKPLAIRSRSRIGDIEKMLNLCGLRLFKLNGLLALVIAVCRLRLCKRQQWRVRRLHIDLNIAVQVEQVLSEADI